MEEFAFYVLGAFFVITTYLWANDEWLHDYDPDQHQRQAKQVPRLLHISWKSLAIWAVFTGIGSC